MQITWGDVTYDCHFQHDILGGRTHKVNSDDYKGQTQPYECDSWFKGEQLIGLILKVYELTKRRTNKAIY